MCLSKVNPYEKFRLTFWQIMKDIYQLFFLHNSFHAVVTNQNWRKDLLHKWHQHHMNYI